MKVHILLVEDDASARLALAYRLQYAGYRVTQAADGETAIELLPQTPFDVVLTDILLVNLTGIDVLRAAKKQPYSPMVILLTGHGSLETSLMALREGAFDYLLKPCADDSLLTCVANAVQRRHDERRLIEAARLIKNFYEPEANNLQGSDEEQQPSGQGSFAVPDNGLPLQVGGLQIGLTRHDVTLNGVHLHITPIEFALLRCLAGQPGAVHTYCTIVSHTHNMEASEADAQSLLKPHIRNLRSKLDAPYLVNDRGTGYMIVDPVDPGKVSPQSNAEMPVYDDEE